MSSSLYDQFGKQPNIMNQIEQLKKNFNGSPEQFINQMIQNGKINQNQINAAVQMAKNFGLLK